MNLKDYQLYTFNLSQKQQQRNLLLILQSTDLLLQTETDDRTASSMGKKIQNYILETVVGSGEFGKVYKAYNEKTGQTVAIKVIQIQKFRLSPKLEQFTINEINTLSKIEDSTHIVRFIEILKTANNYYFVYEYCNEGTLQEKIKSQGKFSQEKALQYFNQLLNAFKMLVKNNIMHRDIKPSNILLNNGVIKLADFGFCKPMKDSKDLAQTMLGSPIYMAPQILKGEIYTMKADIWSLGVVLYEMLYGFCPFEQRSIARLINLIDEGTVTFPFNVKVSRNTQDLIKKMLVKDQFKRIEWRELFEYNLVPKQQKSNPLINQNSRHSISQFEEQKYQKQGITMNKEVGPSSNKEVGPSSNGISQNSQQQTIVNPFTKKHFQSANTNIQLNEFTATQYQISVMGTNAVEGRQQQRRNPESLKHDYSNRNSSSHKKSIDQILIAQQSSQARVQRKISQEKDRKRSNTVHDIREATNEKQKENILQYQTNSGNIMQIKKSKSTSQTNVSDVEKKIIQNVLEKRQKILRGIKLIEKLLTQSSSKINISICCFIAKKVTDLASQTQDTIEKSLKEKQFKAVQKENCISSSSNMEIDKAVGSILEEIKQINEMMEPFRQQLTQIHEPQDIIFLRYGEQQHLTQQKQGLTQLLMIDDYLGISMMSKNSTEVRLHLGTIENTYGDQSNSRTPLAPINSKKSQNSSACSFEHNYQLKSKKELLEEYQKRVLRNI